MVGCAAISSMTTVTPRTRHTFSLLPGCCLAITSAVHGHLQAALDYLETIIYNPWEKKGEEEEEARREGEESKPEAEAGDGSAETKSATNGTT